MRTCNTCNEEKPLSEFYKNGKWYKTKCKTCTNKEKRNKIKTGTLIVNKEKKKEASKRYYEQNKEQIKEYSRRYYQENRVKRKEYYQDNKEEILKKSKQSYQDNKETKQEYARNRARDNKDNPTYVYSRYKSGAKRRSIDFLISFDEFYTLWGKPCNYCGDEISTIGLDRIDSAKGYQVDNITSCCSTCNYMKNSLDLTKFNEQITKIYKRLKP